MKYHREQSYNFMEEASYFIFFWLFIAHLNILTIANNSVD